MKPTLRDIGRAAVTVVGALISASAINFFLVPLKLVPGGVGGIAVLLEFLTDTSAGISVAAINVPLFLIAWRQVDREFAVLSAIGAVTFAGSLILTAPLASATPMSEPILGALAGGAAAGIGGGLSLRFHGSLGGADIIGVLIRRHLSTSVAGVLLGVNAIVVGALGSLYGLEPALMSLVSMTAASWLLDRVLTGFSRRKAALIITDHPGRVAATILEKLDRGATLISAQGAYEQGRKVIVYSVVTQRQLASLKRIVSEADPDAFITVLDASEVVGTGFVTGPAG